MRYTTFGGTGFTVSRLSMGCNRLGDPGVDPAQWPPVVKQALDQKSDLAVLNFVCQL